MVVARRKCTTTDGLENVSQAVSYRLCASNTLVVMALAGVEHSIGWALASSAARLHCPPGRAKSTPVETVD